eukprot:tig00001130_g7239.t1
MLLCVVLDINGVPLITRSRGMATPSFPTLGLLSAVCTSCSEARHTLRMIRSSDAAVGFRTYEQTSLVIVCCTSSVDAEEEEVLTFLDRIHGSLVLLIGAAEFADQGGFAALERLKRQLRVCGELIDALMQDFEAGLESLASARLLLYTPEEHAEPLKRALAGFAGAAASSHACLRLRDRLCVATDDWWALPTEEQLLISRYLASLPPAAARDIPIYLPQTSPATPFRLVTALLGASEEAEAVLLCGPEADLDRLQRSAREFWAPVMGLVRQCAAAVPRGGFPANIAFDSGILAFALLHTRLRRIIFCGQAPLASRPPAGAGAGSTGRSAASGASAEVADGLPLLRVLLRSAGTMLRTEATPRGAYAAGAVHALADGFRLAAASRPPLQLYCLLAPAVPAAAVGPLVEETLAGLAEMAPFS